MLKYLHGFSITYFKVYNLTVFSIATVVEPLPQSKFKTSPQKEAHPYPSALGNH